MKNRKNILVTGSHRSGTSWTGKIISLAPKVAYIHEPFNVGLTTRNAPFSVWYQYISEDTDPDVRKNTIKFIKKLAAPSLLWPLSRFFKHKRPGKFRDDLTTMRSLNDSERTLFKDPIALISAPWMSQEFNCQVIVLIRHPAAFIASLKVKKWQFDFNNFLSQPMLMQDHLSAYKTEIETFAKERPDIVSQGILLWNILYGIVFSYSKEYREDDWHFIRHEDLSREPIVEYQKIFDFLGLQLTDNIKSEIRKSTTSDVKSVYTRNSVKNITSWKNRLSLEEIEQIKSGTKETWQHFYTESEW